MESLFIVFEGGEGSGKTTVMNKISELLNDKNINCLCTREPGGIKISEDIRNIILDKNNTNMDEITELLLYSAARRQHLVEKVIPALEYDNTVVLCDRFIHSTIAYQGFGRGISISKIHELNNIAVPEEYKPDLVILLDISPEDGLKRINDNNRETNRLDLESIEFHNKVHEGYLHSAKEDTSISIVDASEKLDKVIDKVYNIIKSKLIDKGYDINE